MRLRLTPILLVLSLFVSASLVSARPPSQDGATSPVPDTGTATDDPGGLAAMLGRLPSLPLGSDSFPMVSYANVAAQLAALGVSAPAGFEDEAALDRWVGATYWLTLPAARLRMLDPEWRATFGFDFLQVDQTVEYAAPPLTVTLYRGRFDVEELRAAWEREGYRAADLDGVTIHTVREDFEIDMASTSSQLAMSSMNHAAILPDGTIAFASAREPLRLTLAAAAGGPSFADDVSIAPLVANAPPDVVSALVVAGSALSMMPDPAAVMLAPTPGSLDVDAVATRIAAESAELRRMPPVVAALLGMTAGGPLEQVGDTTPEPTTDAPAARLVALLTMIDPGAAETAATVIDERLTSLTVPDFASPQDVGGRPYAELFPERSVRAVADEPVVVVELSVAAEVPLGILFSLFQTRSLTLFGWSL